MDRERNRTHLDAALRTLSIALVMLLLLQHAYLANALALDSSIPGVYLPVIIKQSSLPPTPPDWLVYVNHYRTMSDLPLLEENAAWSYGGWLHARYIVKTDLFAHAEDPGNPWYTPEGNAAAQSSNIAASNNVDESDAWAIDTWMQASFHAVAILDPALHETGYGSYREANGRLQMGAALDVIQGLGSVPPSVTFPIKWPGEDATVSIREHWGEVPSPLASCPGYTAPSGLPIILQLGDGGMTPEVTAHVFFEDNTPLDHCIFDETSYSNPDSGLQGVGRTILDFRDAIVLVPRAPLKSGSRYRVSITANGKTHDWSFTVSSIAVAGNPARPAHLPASW